MLPYTAMGPRERIERLRNFNRRLTTTEESIRVLKEWELELEKDIVKVTGHVIDKQEIFFGRNNK